MSELYVKSNPITLKNHQEYDEKWVQARIAEDPAILGLGDLDLKDKERRQPHAGRLDLLLQDPETQKRYEVELQLGRADESHIIRTIEYWDIEKKLYPQYDHCAVLIAEDITSRFLNVISLFNGTIPLIAIQMQAISVNGSLTLVFTRIIDELRLGVVDEDEDALAEPADKAYWERRATEKTVSLIDRMMETIRSLDGDLNPKYNKYYVGLEKGGRPYNFVIFRPRKSRLIFQIYLPQTDNFDKMIDDAGFDTLEHSGRSYRLRLTKEEIESKSDVLEELSRCAYMEHFGIN